MTVGEPVAPAVGDRVHLDGDRAHILPRTGELVRDTAGTTSQVQVLAANLDLVLLLEHLDPMPALGRVERLLTITWRSGAMPLVVLTKADLVDDAAFWVEQVRSVAPGVQVVAVSATTGTGIATLRDLFGDARTLALVGPSGAGKSTLVNTLVGEDAMPTGAVRGDGRGMHTTTHRQLLRATDGRWIIDTPGIRGVGVVATDDSVAATFSDIEELARGCRFRDCHHDGEPDCQVSAAIETGALDERRLASWRSLQREAAYQAARADARLGAENARTLRRQARRIRSAKRSGQIHTR